MNEGLSLVTLADSAIDSLQHLFARMQELAGQAANGVLTNQQRESLDTEAQVLRDEYHRILASVEFNGQNYFAEDTGVIRLQDGFGEEGGIDLDLGWSSIGDNGSAGGGEAPHLELISSGLNGAEANGSSWFVSISADGRYVAFDSFASNLVPDDTNARQDVFVFDRQTGQTTRVSVRSTGQEANGVSSELHISADGRYVVFQTGAYLDPADTNPGLDIYVHDRITGETTLVSVDSNGVVGNGGSFSGSISADGRYVAFQSKSSNLVANDTNGTDDVFVHDRVTGTTTRVSVSSLGEEAPTGGREPKISANGRYVVFESASPLAPDDTNGYRDVWVHDLQTGTTERVSVDSAGNEGNGDSWYASISADGRYVAFASAASNLVAGDTNGQQDIFVHDRETGETRRVSVGSEGEQANNLSTTPQISDDGRFVAYMSRATNFADSDTNGGYDIFLHDLWTGETTVVSADSDGNVGDEIARDVAISGDGKFVVFSSAASNLIPGDTNGTYDVFLARTSAAGSSGPGSELNPSQELPGIDLRSEFSARAAVTTLDVEMKRLAVRRGNIGKYQSRIEFILDYRRQQVLALEAGHRSISDIDVANEVSKMVSLQILRQSNVALLAQANQQQSLVLNLLVA